MNKNTTFKDNWEQHMEIQFIREEAGRKRAYICSPLSAEDDQGFLCNMHTARAYMYYAYEHMGMLAAAPHAYLPMLLCDRNQSDRQLAIDFGLSLMKNCHVILVCGSRISNGMWGELENAVSLGIPITVFNEEVYEKLQTGLLYRKKDRYFISFDKENRFMGNHLLPQERR